MNSLWYDLPFSKGEEYVNYQIDSTDFTLGDISFSPDGTGYVNFNYAQSSLQKSDMFKRSTIASLLWIIGGFLSLVTRLSNLILTSYQSYAIDKSMLKKIFSTR